MGYNPGHNAAQYTVKYTVWQTPKIPLILRYFTVVPEGVCGWHDVWMCVLESAVRMVQHLGCSHNTDFFFVADLLGPQFEATWWHEVGLTHCKSVIQMHSNEIKVTFIQIFLQYIPQYKLSTFSNFRFVSCAQFLFPPPGTTLSSLIPAITV